jgi:hypothetical protein
VTVYPLNVTVHPLTRCGCRCGSLPSKCDSLPSKCDSLPSKCDSLPADALRLQALFIPTKHPRVAALWREWPWTLKPLSTDFDLNALKDTYDYSCFLARSYGYHHLMTSTSTPRREVKAADGPGPRKARLGRGCSGILPPDSRLDRKSLLVAQIILTNDSVPSSVHRPRTGASRARTSWRSPAASPR